MKRPVETKNTLDKWVKGQVQVQKKNTTTIAMTLPKITRSSMPLFLFPSISKLVITAEYAVIAMSMAV